MHWKMSKWKSLCLCPNGLIKCILRDCYNEEPFIVVICVLFLFTFSYLFWFLAWYSLICFCPFSFFEASPNDWTLIHSHLILITKYLLKTRNIPILSIFLVSDSVKGRYGTYNGDFFYIHPRVVIFLYDIYLWKRNTFSMGHFFV